MRHRTTIGLLTDMFAYGGVEIETPPFVRTLVQPDGDVLCRLASALLDCPPAEQEAVIAAHRVALASALRRLDRLPRFLARLRWASPLPPALAIGVNLGEGGLAAVAEAAAFDAALALLPAAGLWFARPLFRAAMRIWLRRKLRELAG